MFGSQLRCPTCNQYTPDRCTCNNRKKPDKGLKGGSCNRQACQAPGAIYFNHSTRAYYCASCAHELNRANRQDAMALFGHDLCALDAASEAEVG